MESPNPKTTNFDHNRWVDKIFYYLEYFRLALLEGGRTINVLMGLSLTRAFKELKFFSSRLTVTDFIFGGFILMFMISAGMIMLFGFGLLSYQVFFWLKDGIWTEIPIGIVFNFLFENSFLQEWLTSPGSWLGLQQMANWLLENIPLSLALILPGGIGVVMMGGIIVMGLIIRFYQFKVSERESSHLL